MLNTIHSYQRKTRTIPLEPETPLHTVLRNRILEDMGRLLCNSTNTAVLRAAATDHIQGWTITTAERNAFTRNIHLTVQTPNGPTHLIFRPHDITLGL